MNPIFIILILIFAIPLSFLFLLIIKQIATRVWEEICGKNEYMQEWYDQLQKENKVISLLTITLIWKTALFNLYLIIVLCLGIIGMQNNQHAFTNFWYLLFLFEIPSIIFGMWFICNYVYIIYIKCKIGWKHLDNLNLQKNSDETNPISKNLIILETEQNYLEEID